MPYTLQMSTMVYLIITKALKPFHCFINILLRNILNLYININKVSKQLVWKAIFLLLIFMIVSCKEVDPNFDADGDIKKGDIHLLSYGYDFDYNPNEKIKRQLDSVKNSFHVTFLNRSGCIIPDSFELLKIKEYNDKVIKHLEVINGVNWYAKYLKQIDSLSQLIYVKDSIKNK